MTRHFDLGHHPHPALPAPLDHLGDVLLRVYLVHLARPRTFSGKGSGWVVESRVQYIYQNSMQQIIFPCRSLASPEVAAVVVGYVAVVGGGGGGVGGGGGRRRRQAAAVAVG